jgi:hypothetical protein
MSDAEWNKLFGRYNQRKTDFLDHEADLIRLRDQEKVITWDPNGDGIIRDAVTKKPFGPDTDLLALVDPTKKVVDPVTGQVRTEFIDGTTKFDAQTASPYMQNRFTQGAISDGAINHPHQAAWDVTKGADLSAPKGSPEYEAAMQEVEKNLHVDNRILNSHRPTGADIIPGMPNPGGKPLLAYNPGTKKWFAVLYEGGLRQI